MGCITSCCVRSEPLHKLGKRRSLKSRGTSNVQHRIELALAKKKQELVHNKLTFTKILLKFDKLRLTLKHIKSVFETLCGDSPGINIEGLQQAMHSLHGNLTKEEVMDLFDFVDIDDSLLINLKEFLVALTVGYILDVIPSLNASETKSEKQTKAIKTTGIEDGFTPVVTTEQGIRRTISRFMGKNSEVKEVLNLIVTAYLLFDPNAEGFIRRSEVEKLLEEDGHKSGMNSLLSEQRWKEMDWDESGTIDFAEFVFSFTSWVDINDDMEDDD